MFRNNILVCTVNIYQYVSAVHTRWFLEYMPNGFRLAIGKLLPRLFVKNKLQSFLDGVRVTEHRLGAHLLRHF